MRALVYFLLFLSVIQTANAQTPPKVTVALQDHLAGLATYTAALRGFDPLPELAVKFPSRAELSAFINTAINEELSPEALAESLRFYHALRFLPRDLDLRTTLIDFYSAQVGGYYDPETQEMNVVLLSGGDLGDELPVLEQVTYVHEYVHALQDAYLGLGDITARLEEDESLSSDQFLAIQALYEGDATAAMTDYLQALTEQNPFGTLMGVLAGGLSSGTLVLPPGIPAIITAELLFPYEQGAVFVAALRAEGGWEAVNAAFDQLPASTEQILHPSKYFAGEGAQAVALLDASTTLGADWALMDDMRLGEFYLREWLKLQLSDVTASAAAAGWGGDALHIYQSAGGDLALVLATAWDTPAEADEFAAAVGSYYMARTGQPADAQGCYTDAVSVACVRAGRIAEAPTAAQALALLQAN